MSVLLLGSGWRRQLEHMHVCRWHAGDRTSTLRGAKNKKVHKQKQAQGCRCKRCSRIQCLIEHQHPKDRGRLDFSSCYPIPPASLP